MNRKWWYTPLPFVLGTGCIILSPTRELALQTYQVMKKLLNCIDLSHALIVGGEKKVKDISALEKGKAHMALKCVPSTSSDISLINPK